MAEDYPELYHAIGADRALAICQEIHQSSDPAESARLQELFAKFNAQYFGGQLDGFIVLAVYGAGKPSNQPRSGEPLSGRVDFLNREVDIALTRLRDYSMREALLHHMAHALTMTLDDTDEMACRDAEAA